MSKKIFFKFYLDKENIRVNKFETSEIFENIRKKFNFGKNIKFINNNNCVKDEDVKN